MRQTEGPGDALKRFRAQIRRIRAREYRQYQRAIRRAVNQAVRELGLGEETGARVLEVTLDEEMGDSELRHRYWDHDGMPDQLRREAIIHEVEDILSERSYAELQEARGIILERELEEKREKRLEAISQSGELHFLFVEGNWDPEFFHEPSEGETNRMTERLGLNPHNTFICMLSTRIAGRGPWSLMRRERFERSFPLDKLAQYCKGGSKLKLYLHDVRRVPRITNPPAQRTVPQGPYREQHLSAYLGEAEFGAKSFPWYLSGRALGRHLSSWLRECRKELRERGRLTEAEAQQILTGLNERYEGAERRSLELLRETVGKRAVDRLLKQGFLLVESANGRIYRILRDGEVFDTVTGDSVCVEVETNEELPVYDEILAKYLVIRDHPEQIETLDLDFEMDELVPAGMYDQICARTGMTKKEVARLIVQKQAELAYQVTALGAALLVAQELGVKLGGERGAPKKEAKKCRKRTRR